MRKMVIYCKQIAFGLSLAFLSGCSSSNTYYILSEPSALHVYHKELPVIGVEKITLPRYMQQVKVATQLSSTQISYENSANWVDDMDESLTKQMIGMIQKSFDQPNVYEYPWELSQQAGIKIKISISRFIAYGDFVYLDATYKISDLKTKKQYSRLFSTKVVCGKETDSVVFSMNGAFNQLSHAVVSDLNQRF